MFKRPTTTLLLLLLTLATLSGSAHALSASLVGDALVGVQGYRGEAGDETRSASSLYQQYTLVYRRADSIGDSRFGHYRLMLGYEFNVVDAEFRADGEVVDNFSQITTDKIYYEGDMLVAPGALPFRFSLFARDLHRTEFITNSPRAFSAAPLDTRRSAGPRGHMIDSSIVSDVSNGTHRAFGGTLVVGIRNGSYLGSYRDILSQLPRLLVDYKQVNVTNLESINYQQKYRIRDLAFVSLNKKDNWAHFRTRDYTDFLDAKNNTSSSQVMLGTIDHNLSRQWINLTNWIRLSADFSYSIDKVASVPYDRRNYTLNIMTVGRREHFSTTVLPHFERNSDDGQIDYVASLPVYTTFQPNRDTKLNSTFLAEASKTLFFTGRNLSPADVDQATYGGRSIYLRNHAELGITRPLVYRPYIELDLRNEMYGQGVGATIGGEVTNNSLLSPQNSWAAGGSVTALQAARQDMSEEAYAEINLLGRYSHQVRGSWRVGTEAHLATGSGAGRNNVAFRLPVLSAAICAPLSGPNYDGSIVTSSLSLYGEHYYQRLNNRLELKMAVESTDLGSAHEESLSHSLDFQNEIRRVAWKSQVVTSSRQFEPVENDPLAPPAVHNSVLSWNSTGSFDYTPNRRFKSTNKVGVSGTQGDSDPYLNYTLAQTMVWNIFTSNGVIRALGDIGEEITWSEVNYATVSEGDQSTFTGKIFASYYPKQYLYLKLSSGLAYFPTTGDMQQTLNGETGVTFQKLQVILTYAQGKQVNDADPDGIFEERWDVKVKKIF